MNQAKRRNVDVPAFSPNEGGSQSSNKEQDEQEELSYGLQLVKADVRKYVCDLIESLHKQLDKSLGKLVDKKMTALDFVTHEEIGTVLRGALLYQSGCLFNAVHSVASGLPSFKTFVDYSAALGLRSRGGKSPSKSTLTPSQEIREKVDEIITERKLLDENMRRFQEQREAFENEKRKFDEDKLRWRERIHFGTLPFVGNSALASATRVDPLMSFVNVTEYAATDVPFMAVVPTPTSGAFQASTDAPTGGENILEDALERNESEKATENSVNMGDDDDDYEPSFEDGDEDSEKEDELENYDDGFDHTHSNESSQNAPDKLVDKKDEQIEQLTPIYEGALKCIMCYDLCCCVYLDESAMWLDVESLTKPALESVDVEKGEKTFLKKILYMFFFRHRID